MTLLDLWNLLRKNWVLVIALPIVCAVLCFAVLTIMPAKYTATATLLASNEVGIVNSSATTVAEQLSEDTDYKVTSTANTTNKTVTVKVEGPDADTCVAMANQVAEEARTAAFDFLGQALAEEGEAVADAVAENSSTATDEASLYALLLAEQDKAVTVAITEATKATDNSPSRAKYSLVALLAGLFLAICIVVIRDIARGSIHSSAEVEENYELRMLGRMRVSGKRRSDAAAEEATLLAAMDFARQDDPAVCLVPMEDAASTKRIVSALEAVAETAGKRVACIGEHADLTLSDPDALASAIASQTPADAELVFVVAPAVAESADFAYLAPACGCAVLVLEAMRTKRAHLESALRQLSLSQTDVAGFVMVEGA